MNMQQMLDMAMAKMTIERKNKSAEQGQMSLGEIIARLEQFKRTAKVEFGDGTTPGTFDSYRGYYEDLALNRGETDTVGHLLNLAEDAVGSEFTGYKGGEFIMNKSTLVWIADYGLISSIGITNISLNGDDVVVLYLEEINDEPEH